MRARSGRNWAVGAAALGATVVACTTQVPLPAAVTARDASVDVPGDPPVDAAARKDAAPVDRPKDMVDPSTCSQETTYKKFTINRPEVMLVFDRSYSMTKKFGTQSRLTVAREEVLDLLRAQQGGISFGFMEFPSRNACDVGVACCASRVLVPPFPQNLFEIEHELRCDTASSGCFDLSVDSPTGDALMRVRTFFDKEPAADADRFVLLVTDGNPSCGMDTSCDGAAAEAARLADTTGVKTIVAALGEDVKTSACLDMIAQAGGMGRATSPRYFWGGTAAELHQAVTDAMAPVIDETCRLTFLEDRPKPETVSVWMRTNSFFNEIPRDPSRKEGWNFDPPGSLELRLYGSPCDKLRTSTILKSDLRVGVSCTRCGSGPCL
jgi:von Willebrand factor type A domain